MDILIKLKDCELTSIDSELDTEKIYDFYGEYENATQYIDFIFDGKEKIGFKIKDEAYSDFCSIAGFFYQRDFSNMTKEEFIHNFKNELDADIYMRKELKNEKEHR